MTKEKLLSIINKHLGYAEQEIYDAVAEYEKEKISFAKRHCEAALKAASEEANTQEIGRGFTAETVVDIDSILNAYPLKNII